MFGTAIATTTSTSWFKLEIQQMIQALFLASGIENRTNFKLIFVFYLRSRSCSLGIIFWGKVLTLLMGKLMLLLVIIDSIFLPSVFSWLGIGLSLEVVILASTGMTRRTSWTELVSIFRCCGCYIQAPKNTSLDRDQQFRYIILTFSYLESILLGPFGSSWNIKNSERRGSFAC